MITYRGLGVRGRLGNALFELAATVSLALDRQEEVCFPAGWIHRPFFNCPDELFVDDVPPEAVESTTLVADRFDVRALSYLQDYSLFADRLPMLREWLRPSEYAQSVLADYPMPPRPRLGVHVRRGDNVYDPGVPNKGDYHICPSDGYYRRGMQAFPHFDEQVCIFSDDLPWCEDQWPWAEFPGNGLPHLKEHEADFLTQPPVDWIDLFLLSRCNHLVISGSTFGIWGALLADVPPANVIRPDQVFGPLVAEYTDSNRMFDPRWRVMPVVAGLEDFGR